jgi:hypothetical protein
MRGARNEGPSIEAAGTIADRRASGAVNPKEGGTAP